MKKNIMKRNLKQTLASAAVLGLFCCAAGCGQTSAETTQAQETTAAQGEISAAETTPEETTAASVEIEYRDIDVDALVAEGANIAYAVTYGVYSMEGDSLDSAIKAEIYYDLDAGQVVRIDFEEALIPCAAGGAEGWAVLSEETTAALGDAVVTLDSAVYPMYFELGDIRFTGSEADGMVDYVASIDGSDVHFIDYVATQEGGAWYHDNMAQGAAILNADGETVTTASIGTKASIRHGVDFWASPITFPGNIELIKNYIYDYGTEYDYAPDGDDIVKNDEGQWVVADVVTGATLAGAPNYFNLVKEACDHIADGDYTVVE